MGKKTFYYKKHYINKPILSNNFLSNNFTRHLKNYLTHRSENKDNQIILNLIYILFNMLFND